MTTTTLANALLEELTTADAALQAFLETNEAIMQQYGQLETDRNMAEAKLKDAVRENLEPVENLVFKVTVTCPRKRWYDTDLILQLAPFVRDIPGVLVTTVDKTKVEALAKGGMVPKEVIEQVYKEMPMTPAVTIKRKEPIKP